MSLLVRRIDIASVYKGGRGRVPILFFQTILFAQLSYTNSRACDELNMGTCQDSRIKMGETLFYITVVLDNEPIQMDGTCSVSTMTSGYGWYETYTGWLGRTMLHARGE